jgi:hypothetical protein
MWIWLGAAFGLAVPALLFLIEFRIERKLDIVLSPRQWRANTDWPQSGPRYLQGTELVDFVPRMQQYTKTAEIMITLSSATIVFVPSHVVGQPMLAFSVILLGFAVLWGVLFISWMSYCYEQDLYDPKNFGALNSSTMFGLGFGALACFATAYLTLAVVVARAIADGQSFK